jgi:type IV secretion system protein VirB10
MNDDMLDENDYETSARMEAESQRSAERDALVEQRRARQMGRGGTGKKSVPLLVGTLSVFALLGFIVALGPSAVLKIFGITDIDTAPKTSQIDLGVEKLRESSASLDFLVPAEAQTKVETPDPDAELNKRFELLKKELEAVARAKDTPEISLSDVKEMLQQYNEQMADKLEDERRKMAAENTRLRAETERLQEEKRRADEAARRDEQLQREKHDLDNLQRQSKGVVVDDSANALAAFGGVEGDPEDLDNNDKFLVAASNSVFETAKSTSLADPSRMVVQGTIISAVLETAINTELPGNLRAQVTEPVFSFDGTRILMPAGTILIGTFNNKVDVAQKRVLIAWNRAVTPEGKSVALGSTGTDLLGRAGTEGNVDNRLKTKFGAAALISTITAIPTALASLSGGGSDSGGGTTINVGGSSGSGGGSGGGSVGSELASNAGDQLEEQSSSVLEKYLSLPPIIRIPQGEEIRVFVNRDLFFR